MRLDAPVLLSDMLPRPASALFPALAALLLIITALALPLRGAGRERSSAPGIVIGGVELGRDSVGIDFHDPVEVRISPAAARAASATEVELGFSVGGIPLLPSSREALIPVGGTLVGASLDSTGNRHLATGSLTGELRLMAGDRVVDTHRFKVRPIGSPAVTFPAAFGVIILIVAFATLPRVARTLRRQSGVYRLARLALAVSGWGLVLIVLAWTLDVRTPTAGELSVCLFLAASACMVLTSQRRRISKLVPR
jgi:hypothetical protein